MFIIPVQADIYRWVDDSGNVVFSDEPHADAEKIEVSPSTVYTPQENIQQPDDEQEILKLSPDGEDATSESQPSIPAYQLRIISPSDDESIWVNNGNVSVSIIVEPQLDPERGDLIQLQLDGENTGAPQASTSFQLSNISRGSHNITAMVTDNTGATMASSPTVTFHLHRTSIINNPNSNPPGPTGGQSSSSN